MFISSCCLINSGNQIRRQPAFAISWQVLCALYQQDIRTSSQNGWAIGNDRFTSQIAQVTILNGCNNLVTTIQYRRRLGDIQSHDKN
jgi:hypothetical protein